MARTNDERFEDSPPAQWDPEAKTRPENVDPRTWWAEKTPVRIPRPAPVVLPPLRAPRPPNPLAGLLKAEVRKPTAPGLGAAPDPFPNDEAPTPTYETPDAWLIREGQRLLRNWRACPPNIRRQISALALEHRAEVGGRDRG
jgi:hypothetical protein